MGPAHVGLAVVITVPAVLVAVGAVWSWVTVGKAPQLDVLFLPTMALIAWRRVQEERAWPAKDGIGFAIARLAYCALLTTVLVLGVYDWTHGGRVALPGFAALYLVLELFPHWRRWLRPGNRSL